jgi:hypothetical protein
MKLKYILIVALCAATALFNGCTKVDEFLNEAPSKNSMKPIETADQLDAVLATYWNYPVNILEEKNDLFYSTDDYGFLPMVQDNYSRGYLIQGLNYGCWSGDDSDTRYHSWGAEYYKIYYANLVLDNVDKVSGTQEQKELLKADAHFLRAYCYFTLALAYTLYYDGTNGDELGLALKKTSNFEEDLHRASLKDTWDFIESDLQEALKIKKPFVRADGKHVNWRGSTGSVKAFAARYYLYRADYDNAKKYALEALAEYGTFRDYNGPDKIGIRYSRTYTLTDTQESVTVDYPDIYVQLVTYFDMEPNMEALLGWKECYYARAMAGGSPWNVPSQELLDTYAEDCPGGNLDNDLRCRHFMQKYLSIASLTNKTSANIYPGYVTFMGDVLSGPTVAEMTLIVAECLARSGDASGAMQRVNALRKNRIEKTVYQDLTASSPAVAIKKVLQERRREMPFTIRWYDLKRLNANDPDNKVTIRRRFYKFNNTSVLKGDGLVDYTLEPNSRRYALPIPREDIEKSDGAIEQNKY